MLEFLLGDVAMLPGHAQVGENSVSGKNPSVQENAMRFFCKAFSSLICLVLSSVFIPAQEPGKPKPDDLLLQRFLGHWLVISMTKDGADLANKLKTIHFTDQPFLLGDPEKDLSGYVMNLENADGRKSSWVYVITSAVPRPQMLVLTFENARLLGGIVNIGVPTAVQATYTFDKETLTIYLAEEGKDLPLNIDRKTKGVTILELRRGPRKEQENLPDVITQLVAGGRDNEMLFTGRTTGVLQLWSVPQGKELARWPGHATSIASLAASRDLKRGLSADIQGCVRLWNLERQAEIRSWQAEVNQHPAAATLSSDGQWVYLAQGRELLELNADTGQPGRRWDVSKPPVTCLAVSPDGGWIAIGDAEGTLLLYSLQAKKPAAGEVLSSFPDGGIILKLRFSASGDKLYYTGLKRVKTELPMFAKLIFGPLTLGVAWPFLLRDGKLHPAPITSSVHLATRQVQEAVVTYDAFSDRELQHDSFDLSADGTSLLLFGKRSLWHYANPFLQEFDRREALPRVRLLAQDQPIVRAWMVGSGVASFRSDGGLDWYDLNAEERVRALVPPKAIQRVGRDRSAAEVVFSTDGETVYAIGPTRQLSAWDRKGRYLGDFEGYGSLAARGIQAAAGKGLYGLYYRQEYDPRLRKDRKERGVVHWSQARGPWAKPLAPDFRSAPLDQYYYNGGKYAVLPNEKQVFGVTSTPEGRENGLALWDLKTGRILKRIGDANFLVGHVAVSPDGTSGLSQDAGSSTVRVWDLASGQCTHVLEQPKNHVGLHGIGFTSRGEAVTCTGYSPRSPQEPGLVCVWNLKTGQLVRSIPSTYQEHFSVASRADLVFTSGGGSLKIWDLNTGELRAEYLEPQLRGRVAVSADGKYAVTAPSDDQIWMVDLEKPLPPGRGFTLISDKAEKK